MSQENVYKNIPHLIDEIKSMSDQLEAGNLSPEEVDAMLTNARELYERIVVLRYKAIEGMAKEEVEGPEQPESVEEVVQKEEEEQEVQPAEKEQPFGMFQFGDVTQATEEKEEKKNVIREKKQEKPAKAEKKKYHQESIPIPDQPLPFNNPLQTMMDDNDAEAETVAEEEEEVTPENQTNLLEAIEEESLNDVMSSEDSEPSINEQLSTNNETLADKLQKSPIGDLTEAIGINQKFLFMNDLFEGENEAYKSALQQLNDFGSMQEASTYLQELEAKYHWDAEHKSTVQFKDLVERRYL